MFKDNYSVKTNLKRLFIQRYERYLPTAFDESMTILEKINKVIESHNAIIDVVNTHVEFTSDQLERSFEIIDENLAKQLKQFRDELEEQKTLYEELRDQMYGDLLPDTVKQKLEEWLLNGTIEELIVDTVFPDWVERLQTVENKVNSQPQYSIKDFGATGDGITNDTDAINNAIEYVSNRGGGTVVVPSGEYMIDGTRPNDNNQNVHGGVHLKDNIELIFTKGSSFRAIPNDKVSYTVLNINKVKNVKIIDPVVFGERNEHTGSSGEWGFGIYIRGSKNIKIEHPIVSDCWGDGIYIATTEDYIVNDNVTITNPICDNNRRQGISLISGKNIYIHNPILKNTDGTNPQAGLDIEPNNVRDVLQNINIDNVYTENNTAPGVLIVLQRLSDSLEPVSIRINGIYDDGSSSALHVNPVSGRLSGNVEISDVVSVKAKSSGFRVNAWGLNAPHLKINNVKIIDHNTLESTGSIEKNAISVYRGNQEGSDVETIGNMTVDGIEIVNTGSGVKEGAIYVNDGSNIVKDVNLLNVNLVNVEGVSYNGTGKVTGNLVENEREVISFIQGNLNKIITNENTTGTKTIYLGTGIPVGFPEVLIEVVKNEDVIISTQNVANIMPLSPEIGKNISSDLIGSRIKLKKATNESWFITEMVGEWTIRT